MDHATYTIMKTKIDYLLFTLSLPNLNKNDRMIILEGIESLILLRLELIK